MGVRPRLLFAASTLLLLLVPLLLLALGPAPAQGRATDWLQPPARMAILKKRNPDQLSPFPGGPYTRDPNRKICGHIEVRNRASSLVAQLGNCSVVEGSLMVMMTRMDDIWANVSFPHLTEITGYLFFYRAMGLRSLGRLFPNLAVIRGNQLLQNYAVVVFEMESLEELGLSRLTDIQRGAVRIEKNPNLCHADTVDWGRIAPHAADGHYIVDNRDPSECAPCPEHCPLRDARTASNSRLCWNRERCQKVCPPACDRNHTTCDNEAATRCCDPKCLGGCGAGSERELSVCTACLHYTYENGCVNTCPPNTYVFMGRRCVDEAYCRHQQAMVEGNPQSFIPFNGSCLLECPPNYVREGHTCRRCQGICPKVCSSFLVDSVSSAQKLKGCTYINGSLVIQIRGGGNIMKELEANLDMIEEIRDYLKVTRSNQLISLNFLKNLRIIHGKALDRTHYSLIVLDNQNLQLLWDWSSRPANLTLTVSSGKVFFHINPKLCMSHIVELKKYTTIKEWSEQDVSPHTNGDRAACDVHKINATLNQVGNKFAVVKWSLQFEKEIFDKRSLLGYVVYYREAPFQNVTLYDGRDACKGDVWKMADADPGVDMQIIAHLKPFTQYAVYVKAYTLPTMSTAQGAQSNITYFKTLPAAPSQPQNLKAHPAKDSKLLISWMPPKYLNGDVRYYRVVGIAQPSTPQHQYLGETRDYCIDPREIRWKPDGKGPTSPDPLDKPAQKPADKSPPMKPPTCEACPPCAGTRDREETELEVEERTSFEDAVHNIVFQKRPKKERGSGGERHKRSYLSGESEAGRDNDLAGDGAAGSTEGSTPTSPAPLLSLPPTPGGSSSPAVPSSSSSFPLKSAAGSSAPGGSSTARAELDGFDVCSLTPGNMSSGEHSFCSWVSNQTQMLQEGLHHFTEYSIRVLACHKKLLSRTKELYECDTDAKHEDDPMCCSVESITRIRTLPLANADDIDSSSVVVQHENSTSPDGAGGGLFVKWAPPPDPNGFIVTYQVEYKMVNQEKFKPFQFCVSHSEFLRHGGRVIHGLAPGNYSFRVMAASLAGPGNWTRPVYFVISERTVMPQGAIIAICLVAVVTVAAVTAIVCFFYQKKKRNPEVPNGLLYSSTNPEYVSSVYEPDEWEVPRESIQLVKALGQGSFGMVYEGLIYNLKPDLPETKCAIKTVNESASMRERIEFLQEASVMKGFSCEHVVKLLGVVSKDQPVYVIMELMSHGDLKSYLRSHRPDNDPNDETTQPRGTPPTLKQILQMAAEIADGMAYLTANKFVHRDLAARNCMVAEDLTVKIGDFGMTRDIYETDYYRKGGKGLLPVRWMAPESLKDGIFTSHSDVWSYGVVLWEMATLASQPYQGLSNEQVLKYVISGGIMEKPENCPEKLYQIMTLCWERVPRTRPNFLQVIEMLLNDVGPQFKEVSFYHTCYLRGQERRSSAAADRNGAGPAAGDFDEEEEEEENPPTAETPLCNAPTAPPSEQRPRLFNSDVSSLNDMDEDHLQRCFSDEIEDDDDPDMDAGDLVLSLAADDDGPSVSTAVPPSLAGRSTSPSAREEPKLGGGGDELPPSDGSKGSKVSNLSNGSIVNGRMCFPQLGSRTTAC